MENRVKDENYYLVQGWMKNRLGLKGTKRDIYAIIYGFSQDGESEFTGSINYFVEWLDVSRPTIIKALQELTDGGYLIKRTDVINGVQFNRYKANLQVVKNFNGGSKEILLGGSKETLHNNKNEDNELNNSLYIAQQVLDYLNEKAETHFKPVESNLKFIKARLKDYTESDLKAVIDKKTAEWKGTQMQMYLRPETLFNATKFESYINGLTPIKEQAKGYEPFLSKVYTEQERAELNTYDDIDDVEF